MEETNKFNQPQLHRSVAGTRGARRLMASHSVGAAIAIATTLNADGGYHKAERKGVKNPPPQMKDKEGKRVVLVDKKTYLSILSLNAGKRPHIGRKQQEKAVKFHMKQVNCGCSIQEIQRDCQYHGKLLAPIVEEQNPAQVS